MNPNLPYGYSEDNILPHHTSCGCDECVKEMEAEMRQEDFIDALSKGN